MSFKLDEFFFGMVCGIGLTIIGYSLGVITAV